MGWSEVDPARGEPFAPEPPPGRGCVYGLLLALPLDCALLACCFAVGRAIGARWGAR